MQRKINISIALTLGLGLTLVVAFFAVSSQAAPDLSEVEGIAKGHIKAPNAPAAELHVCPSGCTYSSIQDAVDAASDGDVIKVATGTYTSVQGRMAPTGYEGPSVITQVVYLSKTVTLRGGYTTVFNDPPDPEANPTTLDAQGDGRVLFIAGEISTTVEGLRITGGDAAGLAGDILISPYGTFINDIGGGIYITSTTTIISNCQVFSNTAELGGGLYLDFTTATLRSNGVFSNTADQGGGLYSKFSVVTLSDNMISANRADLGGGLRLSSSSGTLSGNKIFSNNASSCGGLDVAGSDAILSGNTVFANISGGHGGGLCVGYSKTTLSENVVYSNTAAYGAVYYGGGLYLRGGNSALNGNSVYSNTACWGGGLYLEQITATLEGNMIHSNTAWGSPGGGGGLYLDESDATVIGNTIFANDADSGGGLYLDESDAAISGNLVFSNTAILYYKYGGGIYVGFGAPTISGNIITANTAGSGGGLFLSDSNATLNGNTVSFNAADSGGGLFLYLSEDELINNVIADNRVNTAGSGLYIERMRFPRLLHTTIARNSGGDGSGVFVNGRSGDYLATVLFTNTILVSHTVGITVTEDATATLEGTLWGSGVWANTVDWGGDGGVITGTVNVWGEPVFVNPNSGDYHISTDSTAIDAGVDAGVTNDIDGELRPSGNGYDIGADEFYPHALDVTKQANPDPVPAGTQLTYTIYVTNTVGVNLYATITDTLPTHITLGETSGGTLILPGEVITWTPIIAPDDVWMETVVVFVEKGYDGPLVNVVKVTTDEGASGVYTETSQARFAPGLEVSKRAEPGVVQPGEPLTYTLRITNTGNVDLHAIITDTLPLGFMPGVSPGGTAIVPGGTLTWTPTIPPTRVGAPDGVWTETVVVTVETGYAGPLVNEVEVTTEEGVTGIYTHTLAPGLEVTKQGDPDPVQAGEPLTYTITIANTGDFHLHATVTDTLPAHVTPSGILTWTPIITPTGVGAPGGVWTEQFTVVVDMGYAGSLTNVVRVATEEGVTGLYTETSQALITPALAVTKQVDRELVQAGEPLTYTLRVTNTGNVDLTATITDVLPEQVTPSGILTWTPTITAPGGVWIETVRVTVKMGYSGTLTNRIDVAAIEGVSGADLVTATSICTSVQSVGISGPTSAISGTAVTLNAAYTPTDAIDVMLLWDNDTMGASASYTLPEGIHTAIVTATAACGEPVTATHTVTVTTDRYPVYLPLVLRQYP